LRGRGVIGGVEEWWWRRGNTKRKTKYLMAGDRVAFDGCV